MTTSMNGQWSPLKRSTGTIDDGSNSHRQRPVLQVNEPAGRVSPVRRGRVRILRRGSVFPFIPEKFLPWSAKPDVAKA